MLTGERDIITDNLWVAIMLVTKNIGYDRSKNRWVLKTRCLTIRNMNRIKKSKGKVKVKKEIRYKSP